jgi:hypothetical protein
VGPAFSTLLPVEQLSAGRFPCACGSDDAIQARRRDPNVGQAVGLDRARVLLMLVLLLWAH